MSVDVIRCRFNAFAENDSWEIPIFSPTDNPIATIPGKLGDYHWVDICPLDRRRKPVNMLPYFGPAWYSRASVALLDAGIAKWPDVRLTFNAAVRRPAKYLSERLEVLEQLWLEVAETFNGLLSFRPGLRSEARALAKYARVAAIGQCGCTEQRRFELETTSCEEDCMAKSASVLVAPGSPALPNWNPVFKDYITK